MKTPHTSLWKLKFEAWKKGQFSACIQQPFQAGYLPADVKIVLDFLGLLEQRFKTEKQLNWYSSALGVSLNRLNQLTKFHLQRSVHECLLKRTHQDALNLLSHSSLSGKELAYDLGLGDPAYFCRIFKRMTGMSPRKYRLMMQNKARKNTPANPTKSSARKIEQLAEL